MIVFYVLVASALLFVAATLMKLQRAKRAAVDTANGYESAGGASKVWDVAWDIIQKVSALLGIATLVLKYGFGINI